MTSGGELEIDALRARVRQYRVVAATALALAVLIGAYHGFSAFRFLTDDAFITFRYASNLVSGRGLVWNPEPFQPVEGYTSFSWVLLLSGVWWLTGIAPPDSANWLSFALGLGSLAVVARICLRMRLPEAARELRPWLLGAALLLTLSNRTFLAWLSSGLETALFNLLLLLWCDAMLECDGRMAAQAPGERPSLSAWTLTAPCVWAAGMALTRPDGLLYVAATASQLLLWAALTRRRPPAAALLPLSLPAAHLWWRLYYYGQWFPNTYYAKHAGAWPEAGTRYVACFVVEYGYWALALLLLALGIRRARGADPRAIWTRLAARPPFWPCMIATLAAHAGYYTLVIGGDHFEYRVYSHLVPLLACLTVWTCAWLWPRPWPLAATLVCLVLVGWPVQWVHYAHTADLDTRGTTHVMRVPIAQHFPRPVRPIIRRWDAWQAWLIDRHVGMRHQEHKIAQKHFAAKFPDRKKGQKFAWEDRPVIALGCVGMAGWSLPNIAIIDTLGLNDRVVARTPLSRERKKKRLMAHDRHPPDGYVDCFQPNVKVRKGRVKIRRRKDDLTDSEIRACERRAWLSRPKAVETAGKQ